MKFKVGDRVKVVKVNGNCEEDHKCLGKVFTIKSLNTDFGYPYFFEEYDRCSWRDDELELVPFTKADLKDGMVVEFTNGNRAMVLNNQFIGLHCYSNMDNWSDTLENIHSPFRVITKVYTSKSWYLSKYFNEEYLTLIWERAEEEPAKKMTVAEIEKELGYKVEIVSEN